jgi:hypothetical protein
MTRESGGLCPRLSERRKLSMTLLINTHSTYLGTEEGTLSPVESRQPSAFRLATPDRCSRYLGRSRFGGGSGSHGVIGQVFLKL